MDNLESFQKRLAAIGIKESSVHRARKTAMDAIVMNDELQENVRNCIQCDLSQMCAGPIPGVGSITARIMLVGEAPGADEDENDVPFVGDSGQLLTLFLNNLKVDRREIYITNAVKCRPPKNRQPNMSELEACNEHLKNEIKWVRPEVVVTLGNPAMWAITGDNKLKITQQRGKWKTYTIGKHTFKLIHTYHPSFVLRKEDDGPEEFKRAAKQFFNDLKAAFSINSESEV